MNNKGLKDLLVNIKKVLCSEKKYKENNVNEVMYFHISNDYDIEKIRDVALSGVTLFMITSELTKEERKKLRVDLHKICFSQNLNWSDVNDELYICSTCGIKNFGIKNKILQMPSPDSMQYKKRLK